MRYLVATMAWLSMLALPSQALHLNVTALSAVNGSSVLECWQLNSTLATSSESGTTGALTSALGGVANLSYTVLPAGYNGGRHNAPTVQWVAFMSGLAHITLPDDPTSEAYVTGGEFGLLLAADTSDVSTNGHITTYPGITETISLEIPIKDGVVPPHCVLYKGPCKAPETAGIKNAAVGSSS